MVFIEMIVQSILEEESYEFQASTKHSKLNPEFLPLKSKMGIGLRLGLIRGKPKRIMNLS